MNLALGSNIAWIFLTRGKIWWKAALEAKYLNASRTTNLEKSPPTRPCTQIWKVIIEEIQLIKDHISMRHGNGEKINLWKENIMGKPPLDSNQDIKDIKRRMIREGYKKLEDISSWDLDGVWKQWAKPNLPNDLKNQWNHMNSLLAGATPIDKSIKYAYYWKQTRGEYSVKTGHKKTQKQERLQE